jgi:transcriptional regulator with XRE-family HTH domain
MPPIDADRLLRDLGRRIAEIRTDRRLTQDQMAERMGISTKYLQRLERGRSMNLRTLVDIANKLHVGLDDLLMTPPRSRQTRVGRPPNGRSHPTKKR